MKYRNVCRKYGAKMGAAVATLGAVGSAMAVDPATGLEAVGTLTGSSAGYGPIMYGLAVATVGILIAVKWIKRAKGAA